VTSYVALCFAVGTLVEVYGLKWMSDNIGILNTVNLIMLTFLIGIVIGRSWGKDFFKKMQWHLKSRTMPEPEVLNGAVLAIASMFLITPGIVTDTVGFLILIPISRGVFKDLARSFMKKKIASSDLHFFFPN